MAAGADRSATDRGDPPIPIARRDSYPSRAQPERIYRDRNYRDRNPSRQTRPDIPCPQTAPSFSTDRYPAENLRSRALRFVTRAVTREAGERWWSASKSTRRPRRRPRLVGGVVVPAHVVLDRVMADHLARSRGGFRYAIIWLPSRSGSLFELQSVGDLHLRCDISCSSACRRRSSFNQSETFISVATRWSRSHRSGCASFNQSETFISVATPTGRFQSKPYRLQSVGDLHLRCDAPGRIGAVDRHQASISRRPSSPLRLGANPDAAMALELQSVGDLHLRCDVCWPARPAR
jgi:hypothetical protein